MTSSDNPAYDDGFDDKGEILTYEGHDMNRREQKEPKDYDQPIFTKSGKLAENGKFFQCAEDYKSERRPNPEKIKVFEKITNNVWSDKGFFYLTDAEYVQGQGRKVFKFKLVPEALHAEDNEILEELELSRRIPTFIKRQVWERDKGKCTDCGSNKDLHFDHILPYSKGGTSNNPANIQLLCQKHNLSKSDKIV